jgi:hypothetical protein
VSWDLDGRDLDVDHFVEKLRTDIRGFGRIYDQHVSYYQQVLPHVLLGDLVRYLKSVSKSQGPERVAIDEALGLLECGMGSADTELQELVAVSFLSRLDPEDEDFEAIRARFGDRLRKRYQMHKQDRHIQG